MSPSQQPSGMASPHTAVSPPPPADAPASPVLTLSPPAKKPVSEHRRCNKPIMEKKRRQRINNCLEELKNLILDALKKDPARHSKLEKADILEMTVKHLESLHRQQSAMTVVADPSVMNKYRAGFSECATEVDKFLGRGDAPQLDAHLKRRLLSHLTSCLNNVTALDNLITDAPPSPTQTAAPAQTRTLRVQIPASAMQLPAAINGQHVMHLVPTCLPSGDIAFVIPKAVPRSPPAVPPLSPPQLSPPLPPPPAEVSSPALLPPPPFGSESAQSLAARTAVVAPLSVALDLSISSVVPLKQEDVVEKMVVDCADVDPMDQEDVWRPW